ncbi:MAG: DUF3276 family protein [Bacteroidales bacterium]
MDDLTSGNQREELFSKAVRAGKRTYFFDVKATRSEEQYLTITESKKRFNQQTGKFFYEKHKLFLYREDFEKFEDALKESFEYIRENSPEPPKRETKDFSNIEFEDLGKDKEKKSDEDEKKDKGENDSEKKDEAED